MSGPQDWEALLAIGVLLVGFATAFHVRVVRPVLKSLRTLLGLAPAIQAIQRELTPNGGMSIKDQITNIDDAIRMLKFHERHRHDVSDRALFECDADGQCIYANSALAALFGMEREELLGVGWLNAVHPASRLEQWEQWIGCIQNNIPYAAVYEVQNRLTKKKFIVRAQAQVVFGSNKHPMRYFGSIERHATLPSVKLTEDEVAALEQTLSNEERNAVNRKFEANR